MSEPTIDTNFISGELADHLTDAEISEFQQLCASHEAKQTSRIEQIIADVASAHDVDPDVLKAHYMRAAHDGAAIVKEDFERAMQFTVRGTTASDWKDTLKKTIALPVIHKPAGIARRGQRTILKHERQKFSDRLCGTLVDGRRLNRRDRRFVARQVKFA